MKTLQFIIKNTMVISLLFCCNIINAQMANVNYYASEEIESACKATCTLVSFTAKHVENKVYLNWVVNGMKEDCVYFIQRSENDIDFVTIGTRNGVGIEPDIDILNCFTDNKPLCKKAYYRIASIDNLGKLKHTHSKIIDISKNIGENKDMFVFNK